MSFPAASTDPSEPTPTAFRFSRFEFRPGDWLLLADGRSIPLQSRAMQVLHTLLQRAGGLVDKSALYDAVWGSGCVEEHNLTVQIGNLRKTIGKGCIQTVPGRGYRMSVPVWQVGTDGLPKPHPAWSRPARTSPAFEGRAWQPIPPAPMLGRDTELDALCSTLAVSPLVCLVGAGGAGKSLLARHVVHRRRDSHGQGCCWIDLEPLTDARSLLDTLAAALELADGGGARLDSLVAAVGDLDALLVLDGADRVAAALAPMLDVLCASAPRLRVLVTCQAPLCSASARLHRLGGLAMPADARDPQAARESAAVALFLHRAQALDARFVLTEDKLPELLGLCRALDGHALAILLAAGRVHGLGLGALTKALSPPLKLLSGWRDVGVPERHRTLLATLAWSHELLDAAEQRVFRRMAVLAGAAPLGLLEAILVDCVSLDDGEAAMAPDPKVDPAVDGAGTLDVLDRLVDRSLVAWVEDAAGGLDCCRLLAIPRAYAFERLAEAGELEPMRQRHARALVAQIESDWSRPDDGLMSPDAWLAQAAALLDEAQAAFDWTCDVNEQALALSLGAFLLRSWPRARQRARQNVAASCQLLLLRKPQPPSELAHRVNVQLTRCWLPDHPAMAESAARLSLRQAQAAQAAAAGSPADAVQWRLHQSWTLICLVAAAGNDQDQVEQAMAALQAIPASHWPPLRRAWRAEADGALARLLCDGPGMIDAALRRLALVQAAGGQGLIELQALMDAQLQAGEMASAADTGGRILSLGQAGRNDYTLARAHLGVCIALLAQDRPAEARTEALKGFEGARRVGLQLPWLDQLSLLIGLEGQHAAAAQLIGWTDNQHAALDLRRDDQARSATLRARKLVLRALGDAEMARGLRQGARLAEVEVVALVLRPLPDASGSRSQA